jgi:hypothetical protein
LRGWWISRLGRAYLRDVMPDNYVSDAVPEGHLRDVRAHPRQYMSLFYTDKETHRENAAVRARLPLILSEAEQLHSDELQLRVPSFFVVAGAKPVVIRGLHINRSDKDEENLDELTADNIELGSWVIPELKGVITPQAMMNPGDLCIVKRVAPDEVELDGDGHTITMKNPANIIREFIKKRTGRDASDLDIVPIIENGQQVGHDTCIFGPVRPHLIGAGSLRPKGDDAETNRAKRRADLMGVWSALATGHEYGKQTIYPIKYVAPRRASRVYASLIDESGEDAGTQIIRLAGAGKLDMSVALKNVEPGVRINLRNTSIRAWQRHEQRLRREREHRDNKE